MNEKKKRRLGFRAGLLIYVAVLLLIECSVLLLLVSWMERYDRELPKNVMERYAEEFDDDDIQRVSGDYLNSLDRNIESAEESFAAVKQMFQGRMTCVKDPRNSSATSLSYVIQVNGGDIGRVRLETEGNVSRRYSTAHWNITEETFNYSRFRHEREITVAEGDQVLFNGHLLDSEYIAETGLEYPELSDLYAVYPELPHRMVYRVRNYAGEHDFSVIPAEGGQPVPEEEYSADRVLNLCDESSRLSLEEFCGRFAEKYVQFSSNSGAGFYSNCWQLQQLIVPGSELYIRLPQTAESMQFVHGNNVFVESTTIDRAMQLSDGAWLVDMTYLCSTGSGRNHIRSSNNLTLVVMLGESGNLLAESLKVHPAVVLEE